MVRDVEVANAQREVDRVEIFERGGQIRQVQREKDERAATDATRSPQSSQTTIGSAYSAVSALRRRSHRPQEQSFVEAAQAIALQVEA